MNNLPERKHPRLKAFDYSKAKAYFVTICVQDRKCILSRVIDNSSADVKTEHKKYGRIAEEQLLLLEKRFSFLKVDRYVIMPNHIHAIFILKNEAAGASPRPTLMDIVCAYKSIVTIACKKNGFEGKLFQTSFYEHIIRNSDDYKEIARYIYYNPKTWYYDKLYCENE